MPNAQSDSAVEKIQEPVETSLPAASATGAVTTPIGSEPTRGKKSGKQKKAASNGQPHGFFGKNAAALREWQQLKRDVRALCSTVNAQVYRVEEGVHVYRMVLTSVSFKSPNLDEEIWGLYHHLERDIPELTDRTFDRPLGTRNTAWLTETKTAWMALLNRQNKLLDILEKAPKSVDFYNRIHLTQILKREQESRQSELSERNTRARAAVEQVLTQMQSTEGSGLTSGSSILRVDDARNFWTAKLDEVSDMERMGHINPEEFLSVLKNLETTIAEAPGMADRVKGVEVMFFRMVSMHEELTAYGKTVIPAEDMARFLMIVQDEIPRLWATGAWDKLNITLNDIAAFVKYYEVPLRSELSIAERRKPSQTRMIGATVVTQTLGQSLPMVRALVSAIDARDRFMRGHSDSVARMVMQVARKMNWSGEDLELLEVAALLHDVGKIAIPEAILTKVEPLTADEWKTIQMHPYHSAKVVKSLEGLSRIIPWVYHHQERWDGTGYPEGLANTAIPAAARIIAVTEAFTVMITDQPKRKALSTEDALNNIIKGAGTQFDPEVADALIASFSDDKKNPTM